MAVHKVIPKKVYQLAVFWRDKTTRYFSNLLFFSTLQEQSISRANKIIDLLGALSDLQIYGATLEEQKLEITITKPAQFNLHKLKLQIEIPYEIKATSDIETKYFKISIPQPTDTIINSVNNNDFPHPEWHALKSELFPFLPLPNGAKASLQNPIRTIEINYLDENNQSQSEASPLDGVIKLANEDLETAKKKFKKVKTDRESQQVNKCEQRLKLLNCWKSFEKAFFEASIAKEKNSKEESLLSLSTVNKVSHNDQVITDKGLDTPSINLPAYNERQAQSKVNSLGDASIKNTFTAATPNSQEAFMTNKVKDDLIDSKHKNYANTLFLPRLPKSNEQLEWSDVPSEHFEDSSYWTHKFALLTQYNLSERTFFRSVETLNMHGLSRTLNARGIHHRLALFYLPDLYQSALKAAKAEEIAEKESPKRGRKPKFFSNLVASLSKNKTIMSLIDEEKTIPSLPISITEEPLAKSKKNRENHSQASLPQSPNMIESTLPNALPLPTSNMESNSYGSKLLHSYKANPLPDQDHLTSQFASSVALAINQLQSDQQFLKQQLQSINQTVTRMESAISQIIQLQTQWQASIQPDMQTEAEAQSIKQPVTQSFITQDTPTSLLLQAINSLSSQLETLPSNLKEALTPKLASSPIKKKEASSINNKAKPKTRFNRKTQPG